MKNDRIQKLVRIALLVAVEILLSRFLSISTPVVKIGFAFVPIALCGMLYGPLPTAAAAALADFLGAVLFPIGAYFPGFTLTAFLTGLVFGACLHRGRFERRRNIVLAVVLNCAVLGLLLNTLWISVLYGTPYPVLLPTRVLQYVILIPVQLSVLCVLGSRRLMHLVRPREGAPV